MKISWFMIAILLTHLLQEALFSTHCPHTNLRTAGLTCRILHTRIGWHSIVRFYLFCPPRQVQHAQQADPSEFRSEIRVTGFTGIIEHQKKARSGVFEKWFESPFIRVARQSGNECPKNP
jgi:hypothetical protein